MSTSEQIDWTFIKPDGTKYGGNPYDEGFLAELLETARFSQAVADKSGRFVKAAAGQHVDVGLLSDLPYYAQGANFEPLNGRAVHGEIASLMGLRQDLPPGTPLKAEAITFFDDLSDRYGSARCCGPCRDLMRGGVKDGAPKLVMAPDAVIVGGTAKNATAVVTPWKDYLSEDWDAETEAFVEELLGGGKGLASFMDGAEAALNYAKPLAIYSGNPVVGAFLVRDRKPRFGLPNELSAPAREGSEITAATSELYKNGAPKESPVGFAFVGDGYKPEVSYTKRQMLAELMKATGVTDADGFYVVSFAWNPRVSGPCANVSTVPRLLPYAYIPVAKK